MKLGSGLTRRIIYLHRIHRADVTPIFNYLPTLFRFFSLFFFFFFFFFFPSPSLCARHAALFPPFLFQPNLDDRPVVRYFIPVVTGPMVPSPSSSMKSGCIILANRSFSKFVYTVVESSSLENEQPSFETRYAAGR